MSDSLTKIILEKQKQLTTVEKKTTEILLALHLVHFSLEGVTDREIAEITDNLHKYFFDQTR